MLVLEPFGKGSVEGQCQLFPVPSLGPLDMSCKVICRWLLVVLGWEELYCEPWLSAASASLRAAQQEVWDMPLPDVACLGFVNL